MVFVAVHVESLLEALFRVVGRHDGCDGDDDGDPDEAFDDDRHNCEDEVVPGGRLGRLEGVSVSLLVESCRYEQRCMRLTMRLHCGVLILELSGLMG